MYQLAAIFAVNKQISGVPETIIIAGQDERAFPAATDSVAKPCILVGPQDKATAFFVINLKLDVALAPVDAVVDIRAPLGSGMRLDSVEMAGVVHAGLQCVPQPLFGHVLNLVDCILDVRPHSVGHAPDIAAPSEIFECVVHDAIHHNIGVAAYFVLHEKNHGL